MIKAKNWFSIFRCLSIGVLVTICFSACAYLFGISPEPSSVQIKLSDAGVVADFKFEVRRHFIYHYSMGFGFPENDQVERARIRKLLGGYAVDEAGKPLEPATPTPIYLSIFAICKDGKEVEAYSRDVDPVLTSWGADSFKKDIGSSVLTPGIYRVRVVNKRASPEFSSTPVTFEMGMPAKVNFDAAKAAAGSELCQP